MTRETPDDPIVDEEEEAAGAEAAHIGGDPPDYDVDESLRAVEEAGEGESEGFELAEEDLIEEASHGNERRSPEAEDWEPEDDAGAEYGDADDVEPEDL